MERRNTRQLKLIQDYAGHSKCHPTAEDVYRQIAKQIPDISLRTVYRNLNKLSEQGILRKIQVANAPDRFDSTLEPHQHICCTVCGAFEDVFVNNEEELIDHIHDNCGYYITGIDIVYRGICPKCNN